MFGLLSQLAHFELESPRPAETVKFFTEILGMKVSGKDDGSVYLRAWGDFFHHSLVVTEGPAPRLAHIGWRTAGAAQLKTAVQRIEEAGLGDGWEDSNVGHGPGFRYLSPGGHRHEVFWEVDRYEAPEGERSTFPIRPEKLNPRGAAVRQIDHVTLATGKMNEDIAFYRDVLGSRYMEATVMKADDNEPFFAAISNTEQGHDTGLVADHSGIPGRSHHLAYWLDLPTEVVRAADVLIESGTPIEYGPGKHGHGENTYLYVREPGGHRVELFSGGYRNYQPDWEPRTWIVGSGGVDMFRNWPAPEAYLEVFPPTDKPAAAVVTDGVNPWSVVGSS